MKKQSFNLGWRYWPDGREAEAKAVTLPYDAMLRRNRIPKLKNGAYTGYFPSGDCWYEKRFPAGEELRGKSVIVEFEGIYMDSAVFLNGEKLGGRVYGYSNFFVDLSGKLRIGEENELRVFAHCSQVPNARWYPGNGIYRPVNLYVGEREHILPEGVTVSTVSVNPPKVRVTTEHTATDARVCVEIFDGDQMLASGTGAELTLTLPDVQLWSAENPKLCRVAVTLEKNGTVTDVAEETFGIRTLTWNAETGFQVNGRTVKLRGGCVHHDNGILGACEHERAAFRRIRIMKEAGFNAIRSSHYPLSKDMLKACDTLGMYVMDEAFDTWRENGGLYGYPLYFDEEWEKDIESMIRKDRNHPCVVMYSIGNEISDTAKPAGVALTKKLTALCHQLDAARPVTVCPNVAMNMLSGMGLHMSASDSDPHREDVTDPLLEAKDSELGGSALINVVATAAPTLMKLLMTPKRAEKGVHGCYAEVDIAGYNYGHQVYAGHHKMEPERVIVGSETGPSDIVNNWRLVERMPWVIGDFLWTGWDYLGEAGAGLPTYGEKGGFIKRYPALTGDTGVIDLTGKRDTLSYLAGAAWGTETGPYLAVRPVNLYDKKVYYSNYRRTDAVSSWTWPGCEGKKTEVQVIGRAHTAELLVNGRSLGRRKLKDFVARFPVTYEPGELEAVLYDGGGKRLSSAGLSTAAEETVLKVTAENDTLRADGEDIAYLNAFLTDERGVVKMLSDRKIRVAVEGPAELIAVGSANPLATEPYTGNSFTTYYGHLQAVVRSTGIPGKIAVTCSAEGLTPVTVSLAAV